jgi:hypothetical protein
LIVNFIKFQNFDKTNIIDISIVCNGFIKGLINEINTNFNSNAKQFTNVAGKRM